MATIRDTSKTALLVVDMQVAVIEGAWDETQVISNTSRAVEKARGSGVPVIWIQHTNNHMAHGTPGWQLVPALRPNPDDICLNKQFNSAFEQTPLDKTLAGLGIAHIVLTGALTNWCIQSTAYAALDKGYDLTLIKDAHTTGDIVLGDNDTIKASDIVRGFNIVLAGIRYPGRTIHVISVSDLSF